MSKLTKEYIPSEYEIALVQLERLNTISRERLLTSDEVKMYDLLVKNLRIYQEKQEALEVKPQVITDEKEVVSLIEMVSGIKEVKDEEKPSPDEE